MVTKELYIRSGVVTAGELDVEWCNCATGLYIALNLGQLLLISKYNGYSNSTWPIVVHTVSYTSGYREFLDRVIEYICRENHVVDRVIGDYPHGVKLTVIEEV